MIRLLTKPYPFLFSSKRNLIVAASVGIFVCIVNYLVSNDRVIQEFLVVSKTLLSLLFGVITFFSIILTFEILPKLIISETSKENWTIAKELSLISLLHVVIILLNFSFLVLVSAESSSILSIDFFLQSTLSVMVIGLVPSVMIVWVNYTIKLRENLKQVEQHNKKLQRILQSQKGDDTTIRIPSDNKTETISFNIEQLLFIKSDGNYVEIYLKENDQVSKLLHRASLKTIEEKLSTYPNIIRTHRSYIVNCRSIKFSEGTARNYQLFFSNIEQSVPVARNKFQIFNETILNLKTIQNK